jgi:hypothetical protein
MKPSQPSRHGKEANGDVVEVLRLRWKSLLDRVGNLAELSDIVAAVDVLS